MSIHINRLSKVNDVIRHIMTLYRKDSLLSQNQPLQYPDSPDAYELRLIDDEETHSPDYEMTTLDRKD